MVLYHFCRGWPLKRLQNAVAPTKELKVGSNYYASRIPPRPTGGLEAPRYVGKWFLSVFAIPLGSTPCGLQSVEIFGPAVQHCAKIRSKPYIYRVVPLRCVSVSPHGVFVLQAQC